MAISSAYCTSLCIKSENAQFVYIKERAEVNRLRKYLLIAMEDILITNHRSLLAVPGQLKKINSLTPFFAMLFIK